VNGEAIVAVSTAVVALTQLVKWAGLRARCARPVVLVLSVLGVVVWGTRTGNSPDPTFSLLRRLGRGGHQRRRRRRLHADRGGRRSTAAPRSDSAAMPTPSAKAERILTG